MTLAEVRKAAELVRLHDAAVDWRETFEGGEHVGDQPFIKFSSITGESQPDGMGGGNGWDGELVVPRSVAIEMMRWLERRALAELEKAAVTP